MKKLTMAYWLCTGLLAAFMALAAIPDLLAVPQAVALFDHLGYPHYLLPFLGVAKLLGSVAVVLPRLARLKEWAYAGLAFDLLGALYSHLSVRDPIGQWWGALLGLVLWAGSYALYRKKCDRAGVSRGAASQEV
jgi:hypothetical protein